ncbi:D-alanine--D-alanine ligase family protein [Nocardioides nematodiphilus]|uniref:D-alanine--D-alanine ligase family protein n=1 Tax=Nocardioides nematodiphilus TaxID=2849669 RepID=UPI001CD98388|nr:ATP-grasp domain-containing protein [Nocardioides nematodiphilus]MCA1984459.1 ATP-grasp domain-containing protein [Nocardioides nematodiphilus]
MSGLVAVIAGGLSHERDVSLASGRNLVRELRAEGVDVAAYDFDRNLLNHLERDKVAVALPALHGQFGEDGEIQTLLELIDMPFVGSTSRACRVAFDKGTSRELLRRAGIPVPDSVGLSAQTFRDIGPTALMEHVLDRLGERVVVKPSQGGSALGVSGVDGLGELPSALVGTYAYHDDALIERFYKGVDVSVVVLESDEGLISLDPIAIDFTKGHEFDFAARYTAEFVGLSVPSLPEELLEELRETARTAHRVLGLRDLSRSDFIVSPDGSFVLLETAVTPGSTETSVFPFACTQAGTSLGAVTKALVERALAR